MARGWESKSVEDQINEREAESRSAAAQRLTRPTLDELRRQARRDGLLLARTRTLSALQGTCDRAYRAHLERALADLDSQLAAL